MGVYLYRVPTRGRKMTTGEELLPIQFITKGYTNGRTRQETEREIPECLVCFDFGQAEPIFKMKAGHCEWWDSDEDRKEQVGYMLRDGKRFKMVEGVLGKCEEEAYALIENPNTHGGYHEVWGAYGNLTRKWRHYKGVYDFVLEEQSLPERKVVYGSSYTLPKGMPYKHLVSIVADHLRLLEHAAKMFSEANETQNETVKEK